MRLSCMLACTGAGFANRHAGTSRFRGVSWHTQTRRWKSQIKVGGKDINLGRHQKETAAAQVCLVRANVLHCDNPRPVCRVRLSGLFLHRNCFALSAGVARLVYQGTRHCSSHGDAADLVFGVNAGI